MSEANGGGVTKMFTITYSTLNFDSKINSNDFIQLK